MDYKVILNLMKEMNNTGLTKLEIEEEGIKITMEKAAPTVNVTHAALPETVYAPSYVPAPVQQPLPVQPAQATVAVGETSDKVSEDLSGKKIVSPMVGTFYTASSPDKPCFVKVGDKVKKGQTVCIIEAMKLMNEIESEHDGEIVKILASNEQMVEYGQPLFLIK